MHFSLRTDIMFITKYITPQDVYMGYDAGHFRVDVIMLSNTTTSGIVRSHGTNITITTNLITQEFLSPACIIIRFCDTLEGLLILSSKIVSFFSVSFIPYLFESFTQHSHWVS